MNLTPSQKASLKTYIQANSDTNQLYIDGNLDGLASLLNNNDASNFWIWRSLVPAKEYRGANGLVWTEIDALTVGKARIFEWLSGQLTLDINPSDPNVRQGILDAFASGTTTRTNLTAMARRLATRFEKVFATGTGTTASPGNLVLEGPIFSQDLIGL